MGNGISDSIIKPSVSDEELIKAVSGYGRELFFSNILDYIASRCREAIEIALKEYLPSEGFDHAKRENKHMDLVFFNKDSKRKPVLVLENKRGSIATKKQLNKYKEEISKIKEEKHNQNNNCAFLLISPQQFEKELAEKAGWAFMGYGELGRKLNEALHQIATDNPEFKHSFEYQFLERATAYMSSLEAESTAVTQSVTLDTFCSDLNPKGESMDRVKLRYYAVALMLRQRLKNENLASFAFLDSGTSSPLVNVEIDNWKTINGRKLNFSMQFQNGYLSVGMVINENSEPKNKADKKTRRSDEWIAYDFPKHLSAITRIPEDSIKYKGTGYMTTTYILPMHRMNFKEMTVKALLEKMEEYVVRAWNYRDIES